MHLRNFAQQPRIQNPSLGLWRGIRMWESQPFGMGRHVCHLLLGAARGTRSDMNAQASIYYKAKGMKAWSDMNAQACLDIGIETGVGQRDTHIASRAPNTPLKP